MSFSLTLAQIIGPSCLVLALAMLLNPQAIRGALAEFSDGGGKMLFLLAGCVHVIMGLSLMVTHNVWMWDWPVMITTLGWLLFMRGLFMMWFPDSIRTLAHYLRHRLWWVDVAAIILLCIGSDLSYFGFRSFF